MRLGPLVVLGRVLRLCKTGQIAFIRSIRTISRQSVTHWPLLLILVGAVFDDEAGFKSQANHEIGKCAVNSKTLPFSANEIADAYVIWGASSSQAH